MLDKRVVVKDAVQIDVVQLQFLQARLERALDVIHVFVALGDNVELIAGDTAFFDSLAELRLGLVHYPSLVHFAYTQFDGKILTLRTIEMSIL